MKYFKPYTSVNAKDAFEHRTTNELVKHSDCFIWKWF